MKLGLKVISPADLMLRYVELTSGQAVPGSALLLQLHAPYGPLSSNAIGSLTKKALQKLGVDMRHFGPHSTRGAAVKMFKTLGLSSEEVCQLGKWKNVAAFTSHYLRLGACQHASQKISQIVHTVSLGQSADPDWSCTPGTKDQGGKDQEGEAQRPSETCTFTAGCSECFGSRFWFFLTAFSAGGWRFLIRPAWTECNHFYKPSSPLTAMNVKKHGECSFSTSRNCGSWDGSTPMWPRRC